MMQSRRQHGSSSELDVFGATSYFAGLPDYSPNEPADHRLMIQANQVTHHVADEYQLGLDDDDERHDAQLGVAKQPSGKSRLAALLSFMTSPSPRASFRKESPPPPPPPTNKWQAGDEPANVSSSSSRESISVLLQGCGGVHELDLGVAMGDRRLQGIRVVRGSGDEERWVVRCSAWDEEHHERMLDASESTSDPKEEVEEGDDGNQHGGGKSDSSSDLFDLDILSTHADLST